jgi:hypothetical protein
MRGRAIRPAPPLPRPTSHSLITRWAVGRPPDSAFLGATAGRQVGVEGGGDHLGSIGLTRAGTLCGDLLARPLDESFHDGELTLGGPDTQRHRGFGTGSARSVPPGEQVAGIRAGPAVQDQRGQLLGVLTQSVQYERGMTGRLGGARSKRSTIDAGTLNTVGETMCAVGSSRLMSSRGISPAAPPVRAPDSAAASPPACAVVSARVRTRLTESHPRALPREAPGPGPH